jgi:biotin carboxyl carrier protein
MIYNVKVDDKDYKLELVEGPKRIEIRFNGRSIKLDNYQVNAGRLAMLLKDNKPYEFEITRDDSAYDCWLASRVARCEVLSEKEARYSRLMGAGADIAKAEVLKAPMPGLVVRVLVESGQQVKKGDGLVIVEAMKMENELKAIHTGTIKKIHVQNGQAVEKNQVLVEFG